ncbi:MAG: Nudix family hydrolase [Rhodocyclaceae bacterium]|nr:Nudix family hydrolase [Rhodocyclaceae bacterium]
MSDRKRVEVAAAVITQPDGSFLLGQRAPGTFYPGYWEFPGGKVEPGEDARAALIRELDEELGIRAEACWPWLVREFDYEHAHVRLNFFEVPAWRGKINDHVHSALSWQRADALTVSPMLPANAPVLKALRLPRRMGITQAARVGVEAQLRQLDAALADGLRLVQVREPALDVASREALVRAALPRCRAAGALLLVNDDIELARRCGADGVQLPARLLATLAERPDFEWVGASCHSRDELLCAAALGVDFALLGQVATTPSHPDGAPLGWSGFTALTAGLPMPVLAIGGVGRDDLAQARAAGAHGIAAIRDAWRGASD